MIRTKTLAAYLLLLFCTGAICMLPACTQPEDVSTVMFGDDDQSSIVSEVESALRAFHAADTTMDAEAVLNLLWPEYTMFADGARLGYADVAAGSRDFMASLKLFHTEWDDIQTTPLGPNTALTSFQFRDSIVTKTGDLIRARGPTTFIWQKRKGEWRVLFADADHYPVD